MDVGEVFEIILSETATDPWGPGLIVLTKGGKQEKTFDPKG